jgi:hypothetical protein
VGVGGEGKGGKTGGKEGGRNHPNIVCTYKLKKKKKKVKTVKKKKRKYISKEQS